MDNKGAPLNANDDWDEFQDVPESNVEGGDDEVAMSDKDDANDKVTNPIPSSAPENDDAWDEFQEVPQTNGSAVSNEYEHEASDKMAVFDEMVQADMDNKGAPLNANDDWDEFQDVPESNVEGGDDEAGEDDKVDISNKDDETQFTSIPHYLDSIEKSNIMYKCEEINKSLSKDESEASDKMAVFDEIDRGDTETLGVTNTDNNLDEIQNVDEQNIFHNGETSKGILLIHEPSPEHENRGSVWYDCKSTPQRSNSSDVGNISCKFDQINVTGTKAGLGNIEINTADVGEEFLSVSKGVNDENVENEFIHNQVSSSVLKDRDTWDVFQEVSKREQLECINKNDVVKIEGENSKSIIPSRISSGDQYVVTSDLPIDFISPFEKTSEALKLLFDDEKIETFKTNIHDLSKVSN